MRILSLTLITLLLTISSQAQPWTKNLPAGKPTSELTLFDYQKAFESYWAPYKVDKGSYIENGVKKKAPGWKQFKRWEYQMSSLIDPGTGAFPRKTAMQVRQDFEKAYPQSRTTTASNWTPIGPTSSFSGYSGIGRLNCVAFHPTDINTFWVGAAAGGLWQTKDNGASWTCLTDNNGVLAVSDIIIPDDYDTSNTLYIATGDRDAWDNRSVGVLKSTDGGNTWNTTGLSFTIYEGRMVNRLLQDPTNKDILIAATSIGVFKTFDGGTNWNTMLTNVEFIDMEYKPGNSNIIYGSTKYSQIYLCTDGTTFSVAYQDGNATRIELAVSPNQPDWVYAVASNGNSGLYGIFKSTDSGATYEEVFSGSTKNLLTWESDGSGSGGQGWYDLSLAASPFDANILLVGGVNSWRSFDGGINWSITNHWYGDQVQAVHADKHKLAYRNNGDVFECSDGGVYMSSDNGTIWIDKTNGIQISQMYRLSVSQTEQEDIITGLQDNGTKLHSGNAWFDVRGGDGMECLIDYTNADIQYGSLYFGQIDRTTNHWLSSNNVTPPEEGAWVTPYIIDPVEPNILYGGYNQVWKSADRGDNWSQISSVAFNGKVLSLGIAPSDTKYLYAADYSQIWKTSNGGDTWENITNDLPTGNANIEYITVKDYDPNTIWVVLSGYGNPGVYQSTDGGASWTSISAGLPPIPAYSVVQNKQSTGGVHLYLGTELGVYFKDGDADWIPYVNGLPNVRVGEIEIYYAGNPGESKLRAATYGRGLWETPIEYTPSPMVYVSSTAIQNNKTNVAPDQVNQEILKVEISTTGNLSPFSATSFTFNTEGTTDVNHDITNARLFYTGSNNTFSTTTPFGNTVSSPNGEFTITGDQVLNDGKNNFWLAYDIPLLATLGNVLDAQCTSLTVETPRTLLVTAPEGNRTIGFEYCDAGAAQMTYEYISNVVFGPVNQPSGKDPGGYSDYSSEVIDMSIGSSMDIFVENGVPYVTDEVLIWVDWNMDGDFKDADEAVYASGPSGTNIFSTSFAPPSSARLGITRMRIRLHDAGNGPLAEPCGYATWGEVEDYSVRVSEYNPCTFLNYFDYRAASIPGDYVSLGSEGTLITTSEFDNANSAPQDIGFAFEYECNPFTQFILNTNGFIKLGDTPPSAVNLFFDDARGVTGGIFNNNDPADINIISPLNLDLTAGTGTPEYRVYTSGAAPNRVCTIQYQDVREAHSDPIPQYDNMQFQIKLYETTNVIEFVYGDWTPSGNPDDFRTVACGLKGSSRSGDQVLIVSKSVEQSWDDLDFNNANFYSTSPITYAKPPDSPKPDAGRTLRFIPRYDHDLSTGEIYALGDASVYYSTPQSISVNVVNAGNLAQQDIPVTLVVLGANSFTETKYISAIAREEMVNVEFSPFIPANTGPTSFLVSIPDDADNNFNNRAWNQNTNEYSITYSSAAPPEGAWGTTGGTENIYFAKYHISGTAAIVAVTAYIGDNASSGTPVYGLLLKSDGSIAGQSDPYFLQTSDLGTWHTFIINNPPAVTDDDFYAGFAITASAPDIFTLGIQSENPLRPNTYYFSALDGTGLTPFDFPYRLMIGAILTPTAPIPGEATSKSPVCGGQSSMVELSGYAGSIQWQESPDGVSNWANVSGGTGANTPYYFTAPLSTSTYYRAELNQPTFTSVYSNTVAVTVEITPGDAGQITGKDAVCTGETDVLYTVDEIDNATAYVWLLPPGSTGSGIANNILVTYSESASSGDISVIGYRDDCAGQPSSLAVTVFPKPATPFIISNENILHSDAATGNQWYDQNGPIAGATAQDYTANANGNYYVIVTEGGCSSSPSNVLEVIISGFSGPASELSVYVYPNPVLDELIVEIPGNSRHVPFEIYNALGRVVIKGGIDGRTTVETGNFIPGVYFIHFKGDGFVAIRKFVKE